MILFGLKIIIEQDLVKRLKKHAIQKAVTTPRAIPKAKQSQQGFTLIEIMVVVVIIAVMAAVLAFNMQRDIDRLAKLESQRFMVVVNEVRDESIIAGEAFIMLVDKKSRTYRFDGTRTDRSAAVDDGLFKSRSIEKGVKLDWDVFAQNEEEGEDDSEPKVWISPLGEITPFDVRFGGEDEDYHVFVNDENQLEQRTVRARLF